MKISFLEGQYELARKTIETDPGCESMKDREMKRALFGEYRAYALRRTLQRSATDMISASL